MALSPPPLTHAAWLSRPETQAVFAALAARGFAARAVGGAVRNALLGLPVSDVDIATPARPEQVMEAARAAGLQTVPTGLAHGTVTVISGGRAHEVTTLRQDVETHGRHATVAFTDDWEADARRRDFTINALYCGMDGTVFDPLSGYEDILARRVRFIGEGRQRIREDYLRILRFFRFTAQYGDGPDAEGLAACVRERDGLALLSPERVRQEMLRLLAAPHAAAMTEAMGEHGLLVPVLGLAPRPSLMRAVCMLEAALARAPDAMLRLAALGIEVAEDADRMRERWRLSNAEHARLLRAAVRAPCMHPSMVEGGARALLYHAGEAAYRWHVLLAWARSGDPPAHEGWRRRLALPGRWQPPALAIGGDDVLALGVNPGPRVGDILRALEAWWIAGDFAADEAALRARLRELASAR